MTDVHSFSHDQFFPAPELWDVVPFTGLSEPNPWLRQESNSANFPTENLDRIYSRARATISVETASTEPFALSTRVSQVIPGAGRSTSILNGIGEPTFDIDIGIADLTPSRERLLKRQSAFNWMRDNIKFPDAYFELMDGLPREDGLEVLSRVRIWSNLLKGYEKYSTENWDGHGALAISPETRSSAATVINALPKHFGAPDAAPAADGTIGLEWIPESGSFKKLFIDIGPGTLWRAYWRLSTGKVGHASGSVPDSNLFSKLHELLQKLS
jgi:hypothetical protein